MNKIKIGKRLRAQRQILNLTREEFSEKLNISPQFLAELENGKKGMSVQTLCKIGEFCSIDYILLGKQSEINTPIISKINELPVKYIEVVENLLDSLSSIEND